VNDDFMGPQDSPSEGGFGIIPRYLRGKLTAYEIAVYVALTWRVNDATNECWMKHKTIAEEAGMSIASSRRAIQSLTEKGIVSSRPKYGPDGGIVCNIYRIHIGGSDHTDQGGRSHRSGGVIPESNRTRTQERDTMNESLVGQGYLSSDPADDTLFDASSPDGDGHGSTTTSKPSTKTTAPEGFEEFWNTYGHKVGRAKAVTAYKRALKKPGVTPGTLISAAAAYVARVKSDGKFPEFAKHPTTWLNGEHWNDVIAPRTEPRSRAQQWLDMANADLERQGASSAPVWGIGGQGMREISGVSR
jgi:hypothetical protein